MCSRCVRFLEGLVPIALAIVLVAGLGLGCDRQAPVAPATRPASAPTTEPAATTAPAAVVEKTPPKDLLDVVRANDPDYPTTRPAVLAVEVAYASRLVLREPVFLDARGDLWITRPDAVPTSEVLATASKSKTLTHVVPDMVVFTVWHSDAPPSLVAQTSAGRYEWVHAGARLPLSDRKFIWDRAWQYNDRIVVPTDRGIVVLNRNADKIQEQFIQLCEPAIGNACYAMLDMRGVIAWSTSRSADSNVCRWLDGKWSPLTTGWPARIEQLIPLLDGTVLVLGTVDQTIEIKSILLDPPNVDPAAIEKLVALLSDPEPDIREKAQIDLARFGSGAWPVLERIGDQQPAEARIRIRALLGNQTMPTLAGMTPQEGPARVVTRLNDGGVLIHFPTGVSGVDGQGLLRVVAPAWLAIRGGAIQRVSGQMLEEFDATRMQIRVQGDEWIIEHDADGPLRWMGNHFQKLLRPGEASFGRFVGIGSRNRWVFKTADADGPTLILDPTLPDPTPRFPVWVVGMGSKVAGWNLQDWPTAQRGGTWTLMEASWTAMKTEDVQTNFITALSAPKPAEPAQPLLVTADGHRFADGLKTLTVETKEGKTLNWPLPPGAIGEGVIAGKPVLIEAADRLFLFNSPGRVVRIKKQLDKPEPFKLDGIFTRNIPGGDIQRIWLDPAGRIVILSGTTRLSICFPTGQIPTGLANIIPPKALNDAMRGEENELIGK